VIEIETLFAAIAHVGSWQILLQKSAKRELVAP